MRFYNRLFALIVFGAGLLNLAVGAALAAEVGDAARGKMVFLQNCALCHATGLETARPTGQGPLLAGVVGRAAASEPDFPYSKALASAQITWDLQTLDRFLAGPALMVPGTLMPITLANASDRRDVIAFLATLRPMAARAAPNKSTSVGIGRNPGDWENDAPGVLHRVHVETLPAPYATTSAGNSPRTVSQPAGVSLAVPEGFKVKLFASGLSRPRLIRTAPNGDIFIAETRLDRIKVLRAGDGAESPSENTVFADHLSGPFGIAFYPQDGNPRWVYVATLNSVVRFPYRSGDLVARGPAEVVVPTLSETTGGHTTRDIAFSLDGRRLWVSVGSSSNVGEGLPEKTPAEVRDWEASHGKGAAWGYETNRADILVTDPEGRQPLKIFATGIRNAVGLAVHPATGDLWASTNERDGLGDDLVPDYITRVKEGGYYGWPWYYLGDHEDPRHPGERTDLKGQAIVPDVLLQAHSASLQMTFYPPTISGPGAFPESYRGDGFAALHGSWNRTKRTGTKVIRVKLENGVPTGEYEDFLTGFVIDDGHVWGRPVGVAVAHDGALLVTDDANGTVWRISRANKK
ncbi:MAG: PQQ-dependent sugar dehydrogenase [Nibricoccus sp.]